jgi:glycosyltransferase involved in cell wall biosynthesis
MKKEITYSFIIPHKNCPELLQRCVDSIPERDDLQVIVVDDNSDEDKKPSLKERKNLQVILLDASQSKGAGRARNVGLEHAEGKWLLFADADDYYTDYLPTLLDEYADDETTDIVYLNACKFDENGVETSFRTDKLINNYTNGVERAEMELRYNLWTPWSRMVKGSVVRSKKLLFDELPATNDKMFCLYCSYYSRSVKAEKQIIYKYYRPTKGSITDKQRDSRMLDGLLDVRRRTITLYKKAGYKRIPSFWSILFKTSYVKELSCYDVIKKYVKALHDSHTNILVDQARFFKNL